MPVAFLVTIKSDECGNYSNTEVQLFELWLSTGDSNTNGLLQRHLWGKIEMETYDAT